MSWLFSQALVEEYLGDISLDGEQSVQSSGKPTQLAYLSQDKMTKYSRLFRFGMMFKPLTESHGKELLMLYLEDFHAKTSALLDRGGVLLEAEVQCGNTWRELLAKYDPDTALWKTAQCSLLEDLEQSLEIWPRWGSMQNGECYRQPMLVQNMLESESGLSERIPNNIDFFHTPCTTGIDGGSNSRKALKKRMEMWPTPQASDNRDRGNMSNPSIQRRIANGKQIMLSQSVDQNSGQLNPMWVEWLMGWLQGWTDLQPLEMDKSLYVQQQHGDY
jgi:hypothetical protein